MYSYSNKEKQVIHISDSKDLEIHNSDFKKATHSSGIHMTENQDRYLLELEIAGYIKDDFNFYISDNDLVLTTGKSKETISDEKVDNKIIKHTYCYASAFFKKIVRLPNDVIKNQIFVDYKNHILSIELLKLKPIVSP